jgi:aryl-alcohol dehydrogenase-like predicted oxidoreductase
MGHEQWSLGGALTVNRVGYGTMKLTGWPRGERPDRDTALAILRRAVQLGVNHLDTSNYYARDGVAANELIRAALQPYPDDLVIVTKVGALVEGHDINLPPAEQRGLTPDGLRRGVEANLRSLGVDRLDVVNLRWATADTPTRASMPRWKPSCRCATKASYATWACRQPATARCNSAVQLAVDV